MSYLVGTNAAYSPKYYPGHEDNPPLQLTNKHQLQASILRASKTLHNISTAVYHEASKWVVVDMDYVDLLLAWDCMDIPFTVVDPEAGTLPNGVMHIRVKMTLGRNDHLSYWHFQYWPKSRAHCQHILVAIHDLPAFVRKLRIVDLVHGLCAMPGWHVTSGKDEAPGLFIARKGMGLNVLVRVSPECPSQAMRKLLAEFRVLHRPMNKLTIVGFEDSAFRREIEASVSAPPDLATQCPLHETLLLILELARQAGALSFAQNRRAARHLYRTGVGLYHGCCHATALWGVTSLDSRARPLECLGMVSAVMNVVQSDLANSDMSEPHSDAIIMTNNSDLGRITELAGGVTDVVRLVLTYSLFCFGTL